MNAHQNKRVLILSTSSDISTSRVIDWLCYFGCEVIRLNQNDGVDEFFADLIDGHVSFKKNGQKIDLSKITSYWYRRGDFQLAASKLEDNTTRNSDLQKKLLTHLSSEKKELLNWLHFELLKKPHLGSFTNNALSKLFVLKQATKLNINVPASFVVSNKRDFKSLFDKTSTQELISKPLANGFHFTHDSMQYASYTNVWSKAQIEKLPDEFYPSLIQEKIDKWIELRIFYLEPDFFASALIPQTKATNKSEYEDENKPIDIRIQDVQVVPFELPLKVSKQLKKLMAALELKTGSIDMAVTSQQEYVFFEVNPIGMYDQVSMACNYQLDQAIAQYLLNAES